jgi:hypothetical protein
MARASMQIVIFLLLMTAASNAIVVSGVGDALGVAPTTGEPAAVQSAQSDAESFSPTQGSSETLFGLFTSGGSVFASIFQVALAAPLMFVNLGVPTWLVSFVFAPMAIIVFADLFGIIAGRGTT